VGRFRLAEIVVIGFGNTLRQDDGFGPAVVDRLSERICDQRVECISRGTLTPELAATLATAQRVYFVDACCELAPGVAEKRSIAADAEADVALVHFLSPEALLVWTERVYSAVPKAELWLMGVEQTGLSEELTPLVAGQVQRFVDELEQAISDLLDRGSTTSSPQ
jgi:hydrogenase maturation protease